MKITYLMRFWPTYGGGETVTRALTNEMVRRGHEVSIVYFWDRDEGINDFVSPEIKTYKIDGMTCVNGSELDKKEYTYLQKSLEDVLKQIEPDVIVDQWMPTKIVAKAVDRDKVVLIKCHHGVVKYVPIIKTLKQKIFYGTFGNLAGWIRVLPEYSQDAYYSDEWVLLSESLMRDGKKLLPFIKESKFDYMPNPLPYAVAANAIDLSKKENIVLFVGRVVELKRIPYMLDAWSRIEKEFYDWKFQIVGDGPHLNECKEYARLLNLKNVAFEGYVDSKEYMEKASVLVMASTQEGFPMVILEAEQCGTVPVLTNSFPTARDIIINNTNGILVENNDIDAFASALKNVIIDKKQRIRMAENAILDSEKYKIENICDKWESKYKRLKGLKDAKSY